ncbi:MULTISPECIES: hypothetical protein [unclassified Microcoleus]|uniref:hypothetical protein n=1 Tax=unclassified Microcoleus TaxID=2642155 RepID=UPI0025D84D47|nr:MULTISPECIES: hypothetical protein [unclassified Microcoleus]
MVFGRVNNRVKPAVRQGFKPLPQSKSPLKRTEELISPLQRTFAIRQGLESLAVFRVKRDPGRSRSVESRAGHGNTVSLEISNCKTDILPVSTHNYQGLPIALKAAQ